MYANFHLRSELVYKRFVELVSGSRFTTLLWIAVLFILSLFPSWVGSAQEGVVLDSLTPQEGAIGKEVRLRLEGSGFSDLVDIQRVEISAVQVPVIRYDLLSDQVIEVTIQIHENVPLGPTEISFVFFEDLVLDHYFEVLEPDSIGEPQLHQIFPREGELGSEVSLTLEGEGFDGLGELFGVGINDVEVPILDISDFTDQVIEVTVFIAEDVPVGEGEIAFFFENWEFFEYFYVFEADTTGPVGVEPQLYGVTPQEGELGSEVSLTLEGEGFAGLGELFGVGINDVEVQILDISDFTDQIIEVTVFIAEDVPVGEGKIAFFFENQDLFHDFFVFEPEAFGPAEEEPHIHGINPQEAELGSEVSLTLEGDGFDQLEDLDWVEFDGVELTLLGYDFISDEVLEVDVFFPEDAPAGEGEIAFVFENFTMADFFFVSEPGEIQVIPPPDEIPDWWPVPGLFIFGGVIGAALVGLVLWRALRPRPPKPTPAPPAIHFKVVEDPGLQGIETPHDTFKFDVDIRFEVSLDQGEQDVEEDDPLTA
jgi:hypothetical protein